MYHLSVISGWLPKRLCGYCLAIPSIAVLALNRSSILEVLSKTIYGQRGQGMAKVIVLTMLSKRFNPHCFAGLQLRLRVFSSGETVFNIPGMGRLIVDSLQGLCNRSSVADYHNRGLLLI
jgi:ABC-type dipeptide/oligopeptide/nickel transport system permease component